MKRRDFFVKTLAAIASVVGLRLLPKQETVRVTQSWATPETLRAWQRAGVSGFDERRDYYSNLWADQLDWYRKSCPDIPGELWMRTDLIPDEHLVCETLWKDYLNGGPSP